MSYHVTVRIHYTCLTCGGRISFSEVKNHLDEGHVVKRIETKVTERRI